jgi:hypothetical protein
VATTHLALITGAPCVKLLVKKSNTYMRLTTNNTYKRLTMNGVSKYFLKKGVTETNLL